MNFNKNTIAAAVTFGALALSGSALANDVTVTPYGKINVTYQSTEDGSLNGNELKSNASRFGLKGKAKLSDSLKAIYKLGLIILYLLEKFFWGKNKQTLMAKN